MKYSLRNLMIVVIIGPPLLAWGALPLYRWLVTPLITESGGGDRRTGGPFAGLKPRIVIVEPERPLTLDAP